jgi:hypothetical protein
MDLAGPSDRKRPRHEMDEDLFTDHPTLYHDDGNVILRCGKTLFCVHKSILAKHSPVFKRLFTNNASLNRQTMRGLDLLELPDDKDDMESFLNAVYGGLCVVTLCRCTRRLIAALQAYRRTR